MKLFEPIDIGRLRLKNRLVMAPMVTGMAESGGFVSERMIEYYSRRCTGGSGLVIVEGVSVEPHFSVDGGLRIDDDKYIQGLSYLAEAIAKNGAKSMLQLVHVGKQAPSRLYGRPTVAPSAVPDPVMKEEPHELTAEEIQQLVASFVQAATRARKAGFDGINIHGAHGYLISQFLSPFDNRRTDEYGGNTYNRARFALDIISGIKNTLVDYPVFFRMSAEQYTDGIHLDEAKAIVRLLDEAGIDAIDVSAGRYSTIQWMIQPMTQPPGCLVPLAAEIKRITSKPVIAVGRISTPELAESILQQESADLIALGRPLLADPDYPVKAKNARARQIRPCIACNRCFDTRYTGQQIRCTVNPEVKNGKRAEGFHTNLTKRVLVIGGGPAGMEAALSCAIIGHHVTLFEKNHKLGGQLLLAMAIPGKKETFGQLIEYYARELARLGVDMRFSMEANPSTIDQENDAVIIATGAIPSYPAIPGVHNANVVTCPDVLTGCKQTGSQVVVIGGSLTGCETALFLAKQGKKVAVLRRSAGMASEAGWSARRLLIEELRDFRVEMLTKVEYKSINSNGVNIVHNGTERLLPADTVLLAAGLQPDNALAEAIKQTNRKVILIGDCKKPRDAADAIEEGRFVAFQI